VQREVNVTVCGARIGTDVGQCGVERAGDAIALALGADLDLSAEARPRPVTRCRQIKPLR